MADPTVPIQITFDLAKLIAFLFGGGTLTAVAGAVGYKKFTSIKGMPSPACPLNGRFSAVEDMNKTMAELSKDLREFIIHAGYEHQRQHETQQLQAEVLNRCAESLAILSNK